MRQRGFTLIELMVTVAIVAILGALALPSMRSFFIRNAFASMGNEFNGGVLRSRNEAVSKNICVTMCLSTNADSTDPANPPRCAGTGTDWQKGWIVFLNPECDASLNKPTEKNAAGNTVDKPENMLIARPAGSASYNLLSTTNRMMFNARGQTDFAGIAWFQLNYLPTPSLSETYGFSVCVDRLGRSRSVGWTAAVGTVCN